MNAIYRAGGYARLSIVEGTKKEESLSITNQKNYIKEFAQNNHIELYDFYVDDGYSGGNFDRPGFRKLIEDIEKGVINCVITKDTSRLGRDFIETGNYIYKYFPEHNIRYISILDNFDTFHPNSSDDMIPFKTVVNDMYLKDTSKKIKSSRHELMAKGLFVGSTVPYGYMRSLGDSRKLVIDEYAAGVVRRIFDLKISGMSNVSIARTLTDNGILPPNVYNKKKIKETFTTNLWKASSINTILTNEVYLGTLIQGKYERVSLKSKKKKLLPKSKWIIKKNCHEAIISKEIFTTVCDLLSKENRSKTRIRLYDYLLKGKVVCADCGKTMLVRRCKSLSKKVNNNFYAIYCCRTYAKYRNNICSMHYYREDKLNELILKKLKFLVSTYVDFSCLNDKYESIISQVRMLEQYQSRLNKKLFKLKEIDQAISQLYQDKVTGVITTSEFVLLKNSLSIDKKQIEIDIVTIKEKKIWLENNLLNQETKDKLIDKFIQGEIYTKSLMNELISQITIDKNKKVTIHFNFYVDKKCCVC